MEQSVKSERVTVVGIGPGSPADLTPRARRAIDEAQVVVGYNTYLKLIEPLLAGKEIIGTGMMQEEERCRLAVESAVHGKKTAVVSGGDAGIYGMAGLVLELVTKREKGERPEFACIPGVSAVNAAAAVLGAPLMHDFAVISLSDRLTPWETIAKRLAAAAQGDFVIALYNPKSKLRPEQIQKARDIMLRHKSPQTPVGIVTGATREGQTKQIATLADFTAAEINMFSLVIVGNSQTYVQDGYMITPRGYGTKKQRKA